MKSLLHPCRLPVLFALMALSPLAGRAAGDRLELAFDYRDSPHVVLATSLVQEARTKIVVAGDDVVLTQRPGGAVAALRQQRLQARIFSVSGAGALPQPVRGPVDDCLVYFSSVYPVPTSNDPRIQLISRTGPHWLGISGDGKGVENGHFLVVFEIAGPADRVFRLRKEDAAGYFSNGMRLVIEKDNVQLSAVLAGLDAREGVRLQQANEFARNTNTTPCYRYPARAAASESVVAMVPCAAADAQ